MGQDLKATLYTIQGSQTEFDHVPKLNFPAISRAKLWLGKSRPWIKAPDELVR